MTEEVTVTTDSTESREANRCIFQEADGTCDKLNNTVCPAGGCSFMVLPGEEERKRMLWAKRLCALDDAKQKEISKKYYGGGRPWRV